MNKYLENTIIAELFNYPELHMNIENGKVLVEGSLEIISPSDSSVIDRYDIVIDLTDYPRSMPVVKEVGGKIPPTMDRHVRPGPKTLCFGSPQDEWEITHGGISFIYFIEKVLRPHLAREYFREAMGYYPDGERSHDAEGIWEPYYEIFKTTDKSRILSELGLIISNNKFSRNARCYCDSGKTFKACHEKVAQKVLRAGVKNLAMIYASLKQKVDF